MKVSDKGLNQAELPQFTVNAVSLRNHHRFRGVMKVNESGCLTPELRCPAHPNAFNELPRPFKVTFSYPHIQLITMPKKYAKKPDRPANLPDEPVESFEKQYYVASNRVWYVRKDEIGKEGSEFLSIRHFDRADVCCIVTNIWRTGTVDESTQSTILHRVCPMFCSLYIDCLPSI